ncbi:MAG: HAD family hydrolase [Pyrinomonadaceae bacterium]
MISTILFDFNGVIINDEPLRLKAYQEILKTDGVNFTEQDYYKCAGMDHERFVREQFKNAGKDVADERVNEIKVQKTESWKKQVDAEMPLFAGVENFIKKCAKRFALGIVSMANREEIEYVLTQTGLAGEFTAIISAEEIGECKPNPECYIKGYKKLDAARLAEGHYPLLHRECLVIEDTPAGIEAAKRAKMKVLAVTNTFDEKLLREAGADSVTKNLDDWMPESIALTF